MNATRSLLEMLRRNVTTINYDSNDNPMLEKVKNMKSEANPHEALISTPAAVQFDESTDNTYWAEDSTVNDDSYGDHIHFSDSLPRNDAKLPFLQSIMNAIFMIYHS